MAVQLVSRLSIFFRSAAQSASTQCLRRDFGNWEVPSPILQQRKLLRRRVLLPGRPFSTRDFLKKLDGEQQEPNPAQLADIGESELARNKTLLAGYTETGFVVNNVELEGSILCLPRSSFLWAPRRFEDITQSTLRLIPLLFPTIEVLIIGSGDKTRRPDPELASFFRDHGIVVEQMTTVSAIGTFNILNTEDRRVGAALLHPSADWSDDEEVD